MLYQPKLSYLAINLSLPLSFFLLFLLYHALSFSFFVSFFLSLPSIFSSLSLFPLIFSLLSFRSPFINLFIIFSFYFLSSFPHIFHLVRSSLSQIIKDCVITVPSSFTQHERRALYTAADIADLKVRAYVQQTISSPLLFCPNFEYTVIRRKNENKLIDHCGISTHLMIQLTTHPGPFSYRGEHSRGSSLWNRSCFRRAKHCHILQHGS